jgi:nucleoside-diphosphate-sugar epimerase
MKIFLVGATGAIGRRLVPLLAASGHQVVATTRTLAKAESLGASGIEPIVLDALNREAVFKAIAATRPDIVVHQATALSRLRNLKRFDQEFKLTNRLRTEGTAHLLEAAKAAGVRRFLAQSYTGWPNAREGGPVKTEDDPLDSAPPKQMRRTLEAIRYLENAVLHSSTIGGIVLRYGSFYGPGTSLSPGGDIVELVRRRRLPVFGSGAGIWSFTHIDDAANATRLAIERGSSGIFNIVDDEPAKVSVWLPELAQVIGARPPYTVPVWLGRLAIGEAGVHMMTKARGSSNLKAKRALNWQPMYPSWRDGFRRGLAAEETKFAYVRAVCAREGHWEANA